MNIIQDSAHEIPSDSTWAGNIQHLFFGSTNWIGISFSMLTSIEARVSTSDLDELRSIRSWPSLFTRISAGAGGGLILYFFILSGVVVIPGLPGLDILSGGVPAQDKKGFDAFALFVLLSFVAGFAEKLVPGLIDRATDRLKGKEPEPLDVNP